MALIGNYSVLCKNPGRALAGSSIAQEPGSWRKSGANRNIFLSGVSPYNSIPNGYSTQAWIIPIKDGGLAAYTTLNSSGNISSANLAGGKDIGASISSSGHITDSALTLVILGTAAILASSVLIGNLAGIGICNSTIIGSGSVEGNVAAAIRAAASLTGSSTFISSIIGTIICTAAIGGSANLNATLSGAIRGIASLTGSSYISAAIAGVGNIGSSWTGDGDLVAAITALGKIVCALTGSTTIQSSIKAVASMSVDISVAGSELTTANIAEAIWNAVASEFNEAGTMGYELNHSGGGGSGGSTAEEIAEAVWDADLSATDPNSAGRLLKKAGARQVGP